MGPGTPTTIPKNYWPIAASLDISDLIASSVQVQKKEGVEMAYRPVDVTPYRPTPDELRRTRELHASEPVYAYALDCGHDLYLRGAEPFEGDLVFCLRCEERRIVV